MLAILQFRSFTFRCVLPLLFSWICISSASQSAASSKLFVRGVPPELAARYSPESGNFACFGGGSSIDFDRVNDNFCDCVDGSDEPGDIFRRD